MNEYKCTRCGVKFKTKTILKEKKRLCMRCVIHNIDTVRRNEKK